VANGSHEFTKALRSQEGGHPPVGGVVREMKGDP